VSERKSLLVLLPGNPVNASWCSAWTHLLCHLTQKFNVVLRGACSNNIYITRHVLALEAEKLQPDYVLMIDSDNIVSIDAFESLMAQMEAYPSVSILGAWYYFQNSKGIQIAAGGLPATTDQLVTPEQIAAATELMEVGFIGFGFCLMRGQVFQDTAPEHFRPILDPDSEFGFMTDDAGFCFLARQRGHKTYLHPFVRVEHLKTQYVPAPAGKSKGENENGNHSNTSGDGSELQKLEHHLS
jgi:GT2 family glycosyltransferase